MRCSLPGKRYNNYGTNLGELVELVPRYLPLKPPIVTPIRIWLYGENGKAGQWDKEIKTKCQWCRERFPVAEKILDIIKAINQNANIQPDQSPCVELPDEAWDEPLLLSECEICHKPLKFNPFVVDNRGRY